MKNVAILLAGGSGNRFGADKPKQFLIMNGKTILEHSIEAFHCSNLIHRIVIVVHRDYIDEVKHLSASYPKVTDVIPGGCERYESSLHALEVCTDGDEYLLFHDAVRPFVSQALIARLIEAGEGVRCVAAAMPSTDTIVRATPDGKLYSNYTLVYDNLDYSKNDNTHENDIQNDVYVALEFVNNGDAFWGRNNLIPSGGVFYLGAKLTTKGEKKSSNSLTWPTDHEVPPIYEVADGVHDAELGKSKEIPRVFIQDFLTKATFRIGSESLHYAYFTVPDLRSSQMSFGLSVELSWESGYEYDIEFGNNPPANP